MNIAMLLQMAADTCPERRALTYANKHYTYSDLQRAASAAADKFSASGCRYVSVLDSSSPAIPVALMGAAIAGIPYVPLNYRLSREQLNAQVERITPVYLIADAGSYQAYSRLDNVYAQPREDFLQHCLAADPVASAHPNDATAVAIQLFTSGTTGTPKAAILRHEHLVSYILGSVEFMGAGEEQATLVSVPPYHIAGISAVLSSIYACRRIVQLEDFSAEAWLDLAEREQVTNAFVVPTMLSRIVDHLETAQPRPKLDSLRAIAYGGGRMPMPVIERALKLFPKVDFTNAYGLTETSSTIAILGPEEHRSAISSDDKILRARLGSVGKPLPSIEMEVRDESGSTLAAGEAGEIFVRGPQVSGEYQERNALDDAGWFPTRDAGWLDEEGFLFLTGRADDVIVRGGENISPAEIEDVLIAHDAVADAAVVALPSTEWGETVGAAIVLHPDTVATVENLQLWVRERLRSSRVPEVVRFETELPYNETGKLLRRVLREAFL